MTPKPASRRTRATIRRPRSWPSRPTLATSTRTGRSSFIMTTVNRSPNAPLIPGSEHRLESLHCLTDGDPVRGSVDQCRHEVDRRVRSLGLDPGQRSAYGVVIAVLLDCRQSRELLRLYGRVDGKG